MPKEIAEEYSYESGNFIVDIEDCIGTGPYKVVGFEDSVKVELARHDGYVPAENNYTGFAGPKKAYMDTITINANTDAATSTLALLNGDLDVFSGISSEFDAQIEAAGLKTYSSLGTTGATLQFNTFGSSIVNTSADMRKAIVAAIDLDALVSFMSDGKTTKAGACPVWDAAYYTDVFEKADYMGPANIELSKQYQKAAGYNGETIVWNMTTAYMDVATLCKQWLADAGINVEIVPKEGGAWTELYNEPTGDWLFTWTNPSLNNTPTLLATNLMNTNYNSAEKDRLYKELQGMIVGSDEYLAKWHELAQQMVDDCPTVYISQGTMTWTMDPDLNWTYDGRNIYFHNAYWTNPSEHTK
jgi:ABC-type transport system substrate-binding protein